jgi:proline dehydrogenase
MQSLNFDNTEVAFSGKTDADLNRSYFLFSMISNPSMVKAGKFLTQASFAIHLPIKPLIRATIFRQFCGGENISDCMKTIQQLAKYNIGTILDYSVEGKKDEAGFDETTEEIKQTVLRAASDEAIPFSVFKVTGVARVELLEKYSAKITLSESEKNEWNRIVNRVDSICSLAFEKKVPVFIDAEESWLQPAIDFLCDEMMEKYNRASGLVYNTFQLYRKDRLEFLRQSYQRAESKGYWLGAKLVRGAYMEKERKRAAEKGYPSPIHDTKENTDKDFDEALQYCVTNLNRIAFCAGTHNEKSSLLLARLMNEKNIKSNDKRIYFSQLLGMSDHISYNLSAQSYNVAKYVPYGPIREVLPYLIRRAEENTSVKGQTGRELGLIIKERKRRKLAQ